MKKRLLIAGAAIAGLLVVSVLGFVLFFDANQFRAQFGYGDPNRKGWNAALATVYDYRLGIQEFAIVHANFRKGQYVSPEGRYPSRKTACRL